MYLRPKEDMKPYYQYRMLPRDGISINNYIETKLNNVKHPWTQLKNYLTREYQKLWKIIFLRFT